jgi:hypothetical protein
VPRALEILRVSLPLWTRFPTLSSRSRDVESAEDDLAREKETLIVSFFPTTVSVPDSLCRLKT